MPVFSQTRRVQKLARGVLTIRKGVSFLGGGKFDAALKEFKSVASSRHPATSRLVRSVASFYAYNTERMRKEAKKARFGNAHLLFLRPVHGRDAWSDVDIAAILVAPNNRFTTQFLAAFLGRTEEAIRFQRRYTFGVPLQSWVSEPGTKYTRYTQTRRVANRLGLV